MDLLVFKGPTLAEFLGQARGLGAGIAAAGRATPEQLARIGELATLIGHVGAQADDSLGKAIAQNAALAPALAPLRRAGEEALRESIELLRRLRAEGGTGQKSAEFFAELTRRTDPFFDTNRRAVTELEGLLEARIGRLHRSVGLTLGSAAIGLLLVSALGLYIMRDITRPLARVVAAAGEIAAGRLPEVAAETRRDELGDLAREFARMSASLRGLAAAARTIAAGDVSVEVRPQSADDVMGCALAEMAGQLREVSGVAAQIAEGNLTVEVRPRSDRDTMSHALAAMVQRLASLVGQVQKSSIQVNTSSTEIAATARQQQTTATEIAATTTEIGATANEITATSRELVKSVGEVAATATHTAQLAGAGRAGLARMEQTMTQVTTAVGSISGKLDVLSQKAGNISTVVGTIRQVADQTNLLSLNAAIEAEKAGEYGRGFAVVAQEVRRLADQTAVASADIGDMVREMQTAVAAGVMGMDKFSDDVRRAVEEVRVVGAQLAQIIGQVQALTPRFDSVNEGMQAQATGAAQISEALTQLGDAARQTAESLRQSTDAIRALNEATGGLRSGIERFKLAS